MRTNVYIDGFNLYYGSLKDTPYKWLDLMRLSKGLLSDKNDIQKIKYFTARVKPTQNDPTAHIRQNTYLRALKEFIPEVEIILGHFLSHPVNMPRCDERGVVNLIRGYPQFVRVCKREEKGSDVNLAVHFLHDACMDRYDCGVVISNDSDLAEALKLVKQECKKTIGVVSPHNTVSKELSRFSDFQRTLREGLLQACQFPDKIPGTNLTKPDTW